MIRVLFFGPVADRMQVRETQVDFTPGMTLHDVIAHLGAQNPGAFSIVSFIAVTEQVRQTDGVARQRRSLYGEVLGGR
jgi:molybdopterin converting factor small subunit